MSPRPWMPLYVADYILDTRDLSLEQHAVYLLLLMNAWRRPDATIPNDMDFIRGLLPPMHGHAFNRLVPPIIERFFTIDDAGQIANKRLVYERQKLDKFSANQKQKIDKRWAQTKENNDLADTAVLPARARHSHSHSDKKEKDSLRSSKKKRSASLALPAEWEPDRAFALSKGMTEERIDAEAQRFRDHAAANNRRQADWCAAWRNWVTSPFQRAGPVNGVFRPHPTLKEQKQEKWRDLLNGLKEYASQPEEGGGMHQPALRLLSKNSG